MEKFAVAILVFVIITPAVFGAAVEPFLSLPGNKTVVTFLDLHLSYNDNGSCGDPDWRMWELAYSLEWKILSEENIGIRQCVLQYDDEHNKRVDYSYSLPCTYMYFTYVICAFYLRYMCFLNGKGKSEKMH